MIEKNIIYHHETKSKLIIILIYVSKTEND